MSACRCNRVHTFTKRGRAMIRSKADSTSESVEAIRPCGRCRRVLAEHVAASGRAFVYCPTCAREKYRAEVEAVHGSRPRRPKVMGAPHDETRVSPDERIERLRDLYTHGDGADQALAEALALVEDEDATLAEAAEAVLWPVPRLRDALDRIQAHASTCDAIEQREKAA
jgi:hypothetical protein